MRNDIMTRMTRVKRSRASIPGAHRAPLANALTGLTALAFVLAAISGCGSNKTSIGVTVTSASQPNLGSSPQSPVVVLKGNTETFRANVAGISTNTVYWQICLPVAPTQPLTQPTTCTPVPGVTTSNGSSTLSGYGTITQSGVYTAPTTVPQSNSFEVVATSTTNSTAFGVNYVKIDSGIRVQMIPSAAVIATGETYAIVADVTGTTSAAVTWSVGGTAGGSTTDGTIAPGGAMCQPPLGPPMTLTPNESCATYTAPTGATTASITATSSADPSQSGNAAITVAAGTDPTLSSIDPNTALQGAAQQDIYLKGSDFYSTSQVLVNGTPVPATWISGTLMRVTIPAPLLAQSTLTTTPLTVQVRRQNGDLNIAKCPSGCSVSVSPMRPSLVASSPDSIITTGAAFGVNLTGGYFTQAATTATFDGFPGTGTGTALAATFSSTRQMTADLPAGVLSTPGLYPIVLQNSGLAAGASSTAAANIAVTPAAGTLLSAPIATVAVGTGPSAIAVDDADGLAVVANTAANSVSIIDLATNTVVQTVAVGKAPTGVAVDDALALPLHHIAVVVNSGDDTLSTIDLTTDAVTSTVSLPAPAPPQSNQSGPAAYSVGLNPVTHRGIVAYTSTNVATAFDVSSGTPAPPGTETAFPLIGGSNTTYGTGPQPQIAVDPRLNWAVVTAGGGGIRIASFVDLGHNTNGADPERDPAVIGVLALTSAVEGVGINPETHQVLLTTPSGGNFTTFSLLDQTVSTVPFTDQSNAVVSEPGYVAAAVSSLPNIGVAVNPNGNDAAILDLQNHLVVGTVASGLDVPEAVAVDPGSNKALVVNQGNDTVSVLSLGTVRSSASLGSVAEPQITLSAPEIAFTSATPLTLTVNGGGFASGAQVYLDGTPLTTMSQTSRQIVASVPPSMLTSARRYSVFVQNPGQNVISNIEDLSVVQAIPVGAQPFGVAVDTDCDVAAVTNSGDNTASIIALTTNAAPPGKTCVSAGAVGTVGPPVPTGTTPEGIAIDPLLGMAVVANNGSNDATVIDTTGTNPPAPVTLGCGGCTDVTGVGMDLDSGLAYVTGVSSQGNGVSNGNAAGVILPQSGIPSNATSGGNNPSFDAVPEAIAVDQYLHYLGVAVGGATSFPSSSTVDIFNLNSGPPVVRTGGFNLPTGILFDPLNQVFVVANSLQNDVGFVDPVSGTTTFAQVGMNPTALDYDFQTSTLVTANNASRTMSIIDYTCPPGFGASCSVPQVRDILGIGGSPQFSVAIDPKLNLAVLTDNVNNRVLLVPLP